MENKIEKLTFKNVIMSIGVLPASYVDSMSYYETLLWLINYLENTVIPTVNNNGQAVEELQNLYIELKSYVDTYFDNLDVQEEINNKLDEMVEAGTLQEIIAEYLNSKAVFGFDTVADMKEATNLIDGSYAETLGYHSKNDGGSSLYKIRNITNDDVIDEASIIALNDDNLIAELILTDYINAEQFGAYGDNTHDDIVALQKLINYATNKYKIIMNKEYLISSTLNIVFNNCNIDINKINYTGSEYAVKYTGELGNLHIHNITSNYDGILLEGTSSQRTAYNNFIFDFLYCSNNGITLYASSGYLQYNDFKFEYIRATNICIYLKSNTSADNWITECKYWGGHMSSLLFNTPNNYCIYADGTSSFNKISTQKFYNVGFEGTKIGCYMANVSGFVFNYPRARESIETGVFKLVGQCRNNSFNLEMFKISFIDYSELTNFSTQNLFKGSFQTNGGSPYVFTEFVVDHEGMKSCNQTQYVYNNYSGGGSMDLDPTQSRRGIPNEILAGSNTITINTKLYNAYNINTIIMKIGTISAENSKLVDGNGNTVFDFSPYPYKTLRLTFLPQSITDVTQGNILVEEITPQV